VRGGWVGAYACEVYRISGLLMGERVFEDGSVKIVSQKTAVSLKVKGQCRSDNDYAYYLLVNTIL
jgi:hypothetical protein